MKPPSGDILDVEWKGESPVVTIGIDEAFRCRFHRHGSVGEDAEFEILDTSVLIHENTETEYLYPERMKPGWTGGDAQTGYWYFRGIRPGKTRLIIRVLFRFDVESEHTLDVTVK
jgi:hypothetical protein